MTTGGLSSRVGLAASGVCLDLGGRGEGTQGFGCWGLGLGVRDYGSGPFPPTLAQTRLQPLHPTPRQTFKTQTPNPKRRMMTRFDARRDATGRIYEYQCPSAALVRQEGECDASALSLKGARMSLEGVQKVKEVLKLFLQ